MLMFRAWSIVFPKGLGPGRASYTIFDRTLPTLVELPEYIGDVRVPKLNKAQTPRKSKADPLRVACEPLGVATVGLKGESKKFCGS